MLFADRVDAGRRLAAGLQHLRGQDVVVLGLPRGGVPVAEEVARSLGAPLDVIVVRKIGVPFQPELGMGAIGEDGVRIVDVGVMEMTGATDREFGVVEARERTELERRSRRFRGNRTRVPLVGRTAVIVDDGIATGSTARAACQVARAHGATTGGARRPGGATRMGGSDRNRCRRADCARDTSISSGRSASSIATSPPPRTTRSSPVFVAPRRAPMWTTLHRPSGTTRSSCRRGRSGSAVIS